MPINFGNYAQRRIHDATQGRGDRMRGMLGQQASHPNVSNGGGGGDRRNRGTATTTANGGSITTGNVNPEVKATISSQGGQAIADASGKDGKGGGRKPVSFATYASQREPLRSPAPTHDVPGYNAAVDRWRGTADSAFAARNQHHAQAGADHDRRMKEYNNAVKGAAGLGKPPVTTLPISGQPNQGGYGSKPGDHTNSGPGGGRDKGKMKGGYPMMDDGAQEIIQNVNVPGGWSGGFPNADDLMRQFEMDPQAGGMSFQQWVAGNPELLAMLQKYGINLGFNPIN